MLFLLDDGTRKILALATFYTPAGFLYAIIYLLLDDGTRYKRALATFYTPAGEGINASFDKKTLKRLQEIENMKPDFKEHLFSIIDSVIRDYKTQQAYS